MRLKILHIVTWSLGFFLILFSLRANTQVLDNAPGDSIVRITSISISGNKTTKEKIILREVVLRPGDVLPLEQFREKIRKSRENIRNTGLFNFVEVGWTTDPGHPQEATVSVDVVERWYVWPIPILKISDRNFNVWWKTRDLSRLSYGFYLDWRNVRGRMENLRATFQYGFDQLYELHYQVPYVNASKTVGAGFGAGWLRNREVALRTVGNKEEWFSDNDAYVRQDYYAFLELFLRRGIYNSHQLQFRFTRHHFSDSLMVVNPYYSDGQATKQYFSLYYKYKSDHRNFKPYPLKGYYFDIELMKTGLGLSGEKGVDFFYATATFRKYWQIAPRWYYATGLNAKFSGNGHQPWFLVRGVGYGRDIVRSYEYYLVDGQNFGIFKSNLKFAILPERESNIGFIRNEKFGRVHLALYANAFLDVGYADNREFYGNTANDLENRLLVGYGAGIDFVTYYDIVIRAEYSFNRLGESGLFIHFRAPI